MAKSNSNPNLASMAADPSAFRAALLIDTDSGPKPLASCLDPWQAADFAALDPGWRRVAGQKIAAGGYQRAWLERPRGHSKTGDVAAMVAWVLFASRRQLAGVAAAADEDQARLLRDAVAKLTSLNPWLAEILDVQASRIVNQRTGSALTILSSDAPSSFGLTPDFVVADELSHWAGRDLWDSLLSAAAKRAGCLLVVIGNAGYQDSWQWQTRQAVQADPAWYFNSLPGPVASWISPAALAEQKRLLPSIAYDRLWGNVWTSGAGDAIAPHDLEAIVDRAAEQLTQPRAGWVYVAGLDLSVSRDHSAFVLLGKHVGYRKIKTRRRRRRLPQPLEIARDLGMLEPVEPDDDEDDFNEVVYQTRDVGESGTGKLRVARLRVWRPEDSGGRIDLAAVEEFCLKVHRRFGLAALAVDPYQAERSAQALALAGVPIKMIPPTASSLQTQASSLLEAVADRALTLIPDERLITDLRRLRIVERGQTFRLESPRVNDGRGTRHGDLASALCLALQVSKEFDDPQGDDSFAAGLFGDGRLIH